MGGEGSVGGKGKEGECGWEGGKTCVEGKGSVWRREWGWEGTIQFKNSNFHVSDSLQAISLVSPSPHHHCQLRTETVEIAR